MANNYSINYEDDRFKAIEAEKEQQLKETTAEYDEMINNADSIYQQQIDASKEYAQKQAEMQQANTDFAMQKIEQEKEQATKDYQKEQKGAYTDYQKQINEYGVNAERMASSGLLNSGYSESSRVSMYNTYQNRYMAARESYNKALQNFTNAMTEATLANNSKLAEIAYNAQAQQLELALKGFEYKNTLVLQRRDAINAVNDRNYTKYRDLVSQMNTENQMKESIRQFNQEQENWKKEFELAKKKVVSSGSSGGTAKKKKVQEEKKIKKEVEETPKTTGTNSVVNTSKSTNYVGLNRLMNQTTEQISAFAKKNNMSYMEAYNYLMK